MYYQPLVISHIQIVLLLTRIQITPKQYKRIKHSKNLWNAGFNDFSLFQSYSPFLNIIIHSYQYSVLYVGCHHDQTSAYT